MIRFISHITEEQLKRERAKARDLRKTGWWKRKRSQGHCYFCGKKSAPGELTMDHIVPLVRGGKSTRANIVAACKICNSKKKHMLPVEWEEYLETLRTQQD
jgi:5-methylcytosine-specific restriction endonuclease McrA